uniref:Uncharacterized protein n=1 Tax=Physcomitrium patens TaxID=3218 RepID=A0A2K1JVV8_PHYPA|nr:hypothetical protein PHYPA_015431 [Physcomitrium patens]
MEEKKTSRWSCPVRSPPRAMTRRRTPAFTAPASGVKNRLANNSTGKATDNWVQGSGETMDEYGDDLRSSALNLSLSLSLSK